MLMRFSFLVVTTATIFCHGAFAATSAENRKDQAVELMLGSYGYTVGLLVRDDKIVELGYSGLEITPAEEGEIDPENDRWSQSLFVHARHFHGNSFNTTYGVSWEDSGFGRDPYHRSERSMLFVDLALGNQWSWRFFTLGADWIGVGIPAFERVRVRDDGSATDDGRRARIATREWQGVEVRYMTIYAGLAF